MGEGRLIGEELRYQETLGADVPEERTVSRRIDDLEARSQHGHRVSPHLQGPPVGGSINPKGQPAHHRHSGPTQGPTQGLGGPPSHLGGSTGPHHGHSRPVEELLPPVQEE